MDHGHGAMEEHGAWMEHGVHMEAAGAARCTARGFCVFCFFASRFLYFNNLYSSSFIFTPTSAVRQWPTTHPHTHTHT